MLTTNAIEDAFTLDVHVIIDVSSGNGPAPCGEGTNDNCAPTCASACVSGGV